MNKSTIQKTETLGSGKWLELKTGIPTRDLDEGEDIETHRVPYGELGNFLDESIENGDRIDAKVLSFQFHINLASQAGKAGMPAFQ